MSANDDNVVDDLNSLIADLESPAKSPVPPAPAPVSDGIRPDLEFPTVEPDSPPAPFADKTQEPSAPLADPPLVSQKPVPEAPIAPPVDPFQSPAPEPSAPLADPPLVSQKPVPEAPIAPPVDPFQSPAPEPSAPPGPNPPQDAPAEPAPAAPESFTAPAEAATSSVDPFQAPTAPGEAVPPAPAPAAPASGGEPFVAAPEPVQPDAVPVSPPSDNGPASQGVAAPEAPASPVPDTFSQPGTEAPPPAPSTATPVSEPFRPAPIPEQAVSDTVQITDDSPYGEDSSPKTEASPAQIDLVPVDILFKIAEESGNVVGGDTSAIQSIRKQAKQGTAPKSKLAKAQSKVKFDSLPFESVLEGHPLIVACYSPSGGAGKSSTAMNLGIYMATVAQKMAQAKGPDARVPRVLTLDGDIVTGSLSLRLTGKVKPNIYDLQRYVDERINQGLDFESAWPSSFDVEKPGEKPMYKFTHWPDNPSNFGVLAAPEDPSHFWKFGPQDYKRILKMLGRFYDVIIIDCGTDIVLDTQRAWLSHAHEIFMLTTPDSDRLYNSAKVARLISASKPHPQDHRGEQAKKLPPLAPSSRVSLLITRADIDSGLPLEETIDELFPWLKGKDQQKFWMKDVYYEMTKVNNCSRFLVKENQDYAKVIGQMAKRAFSSYVDSRNSHALPSAE